MWFKLKRSYRLAYIKWTDPFNSGIHEWKYKKFDEIRLFISNHTFNRTKRVTLSDWKNKLTKNERNFSVEFKR